VRAAHAGRTYIVPNGTTNANLNKPNDFDIFIQIGDSISKRADSDTLFVYREGKEYFFVANPLYYPGWE